MERERFDGADVSHLLRAFAETLDWPRLIRRFGKHWHVLFAHLVLFTFIYPGERHRIPESVMRRSIRMIEHEMVKPGSKMHLPRDAPVARSVPGRHQGLGLPGRAAGAARRHDRGGGVDLDRGDRRGGEPPAHSGGRASAPGSADPLSRFSGAAHRPRAFSRASRSSFRKQLGVPDVRRDRHDLRVAETDELGVDHHVAHVDVGEEPPVAVALLDVELEPDALALCQPAVRRPRPTAPRPPRPGAGVASRGCPSRCSGPSPTGRVGSRPRWCRRRQPAPRSPARSGRPRRRRRRRRRARSGAMPSQRQSASGRRVACIRADTCRAAASGQHLAG